MNLSRSPQAVLIFSMATLLMTAKMSYADRAWDLYLALTPAQHQQLKTANGSKKKIVDPAKLDKDSATQNLITQVLNNAGNAVVQPILNQVLSDSQTVDNTQDTYWQVIQGFLAPTQVAKIFLKDHPPKNPAMAAAPNANPGQHKPNWNTYFGFNSTTEAQLKAADNGKNNTLKGIRGEKEAAIKQLGQLVQSNAADSAIQPTLTKLFTTIQTEHQTDETFWGATLPGFLSPTQMSKLYLHRHAPKGSFDPQGM